MKKHSRVLSLILLAALLLSVFAVFPAVSAATGTTVSGQIEAYNPRTAFTVRLMNGATAVKSVTVPATTGSGRTVRPFTLTDVPAGTYDLVVSKSGSLPFTVTGVIVSGAPVDLTVSGDPAVSTVSLLCGDISNDGYIDGTDAALLAFDLSKNDAAASRSDTDVNGDTFRDALDVALLSGNLLKSSEPAAFDNPVGTTLTITTAESIDNFWGVSDPTLNTANAVEGSGSVSFHDGSCAVVCYSIENATGIIDASELQTGLTVHLSIYVEDASKLVNPGSFELYGGQPSASDPNSFPAFAWDLSGKLKTGWNELALPFSEATAIKAGNSQPSLTAVRSFRFYQYVKSDTTFCIDNVYLTSPVSVAHYYTNNLFCLDDTSAVVGSSDYSEAAWTTAGATASFSSNGSRLMDTGDVVLNIAAGQTGVMCKNFSNTDLSDYDYAYLWLYTDNAAALQGGQLEFTSAGQPDCCETSWDVTSLGLVNGWNELKLPLSKSGDAEWSIINYLRFHFYAASAATVKVEGVYFGTAEQIAALSNVKAPTSRPVFELDNCDTAANWSGTGLSFVAANGTNAVEGAGYLSSSLSGAGDIVFSKTWRATDHWMYQENAVVNTWRRDIRDYADSQLVVSLYISNVSAVAGGQVELTSAYMPDTDEIGWNITDYPLTNGWNTLVLPFADANVIGTPDLREINFLRIYFNCTGAVTTGIDNIYLGDTAPLRAVTFTASDIKSGSAAKTVTETRYYKDGARIRALNQPAIGYAADTDFLGWVTGTKTYLPGDVFTVNGDMTLTASYQLKPTNTAVKYAFALNDGGTDGAVNTASDTGRIATVESAVAGTPNGVAEGAVWIKSPTFGRVLDFSAEGSYLSASGASFKFDNTISVETWFNAPDRTSSNRYILASDYLNIYLKPSDGSLNVKCGSTTVTATQSNLGGDIIDGHWHHLQVVYASGKITIYLDGQSVKGPTTVTILSSRTVSSILVGAASTSRTSNSNFDGHLARFAISYGTSSLYFPSVTVASTEYVSDTSLTMKHGVVIDRRQYWNYNPLTYEGSSVSPIDIANIKSLGFDHVKLLLTPNWLIDENGHLLEENMTYILPLLEQINKQNFNCLLCLHPEEGFKGTLLNPSALGLWENFLAELVDYLGETVGTSRIALQLMTEPNSQNTSRNWSWYSDRMWAAARNADENLMIVTSSDDTGNFERIKAMTPAFDYNLVYSFTTYEPMTVGFNNYNQGSFWPYVRGVVYPVPAGMSTSQINALIEDNLALVPESLKAEGRTMLSAYYKGTGDMWRSNAYSGTLYDANWHLNRCSSLNDWSNANGGNIHLMAVEFGCSDTQYNQVIFGAVPGSGISDSTRLTMIDHMSNAFDTYNIGWSYWSYNEYFHLLDTTAHLSLHNANLSPAQLSQNVDSALINILLH